MGETKRSNRQLSNRRRSGSQLVEFALVIPIFLIVLFGICQYALLFWAYITIRTASAIGARQAIISPGNVALITTASKNAVNAPPLFDSNQCTVVVNTNVISGTLITSIQVKYPFKILVPYVIPPFKGGTSMIKTVTATTVVQ